MKFNILFLFLLASLNSYSAEYLQTIKEDILSPYTTEALPLVKIGTGLTLLTYFLKNSSLQPDIAHAKPLGKYSKIGYNLGQLLPNVTYAVLMGGDYLITSNKKSLERMELIVKATIYADMTTELLKRSFNENRPNGGKLSFPSGHATCAFAFASVISMEHTLPWAIAANTMASFVAFSRMNDNAHYLHDVVAGATIGSMYGVGLYYANKNRDHDKNVENPSVFVLVPIRDGIASSYMLNF